MKIPLILTIIGLTLILIATPLLLYEISQLIIGILNPARIFIGVLLFMVGLTLFIEFLFPSVYDKFGK